MIRTEYKIIGGEKEKLVQLTPDFKVTSISVTRRIDSNMIKNVSKSFKSIEDAVDNFIYTLIREYLHCIVEDLVESAQYIDDTETEHKVIMYCKRIDRNEIEIMKKSDFIEFRNQLIEFFKKHWEWAEALYNDKEFMNEQNNK